MTRYIAIVWFAICCSLAQAKEIIPPAPQNHFNDYAHVTSPSTANQLNNELAQFERDTGNQFVVAIYPKMESDSSIEDYTVRVARAWRAGGKEKNNGVVLFIFTQDHKLFIQTGYGLEGALPDVMCKQIIDNEITPRFKQGDFNGGVTAGVHAIIAASKGEYKGTGRTIAESKSSQKTDPTITLAVLFMFGVPLLLLFLGLHRARRGYTIRRSGYSGGFWTGGMSSGGWSSGGGGFSGGGGSFSGGGGSFGGGGAGGSW